MASSGCLRLAIKAKMWNPSQHEWNLASRCVQIEEKERIGNFIFKRDAKLAMTGRLLLRYAVSKILGASPSFLKFGRTDKGKPYLLDLNDQSIPAQNINFNVSHQGDYVVFASDKSRLIGVDVMKVEWLRNKPLRDFFSTMRRQLTQHEWSEVNKRSNDMEQLKVFYRLWCLKESLVKALGTGIGFEVGRLDFYFNTAELTPDCVVNDTRVKIDGLINDSWRFEETLLEDHCVAVAVYEERKKLDEETDKDISVPSFSVMTVSDLLSYSEPLEESFSDTEYWLKFNSRLEDPDSSS